VTYTVQHGSDEQPGEQTAETVGAATRLAVTFIREHRRNVRVRLPTGLTMDFDSFQAAVFRGDLKD
jgi:hypothetical protein